ncbi:G1/S-specific cyclin-E2 [Siniperca chuatsi]|uniref:G1/S-specific cyclin-E2 n=1 Tax=Siniperca chuatsi TaxID=119488 RepID=UPI001CE18390|nr:G1/S-specific cyclin-E2 [Siniperca chuatsi]XP_044028755.1 G1/S-specific cyclin-E2 [Siniperca chuatsi]XP_044028756.1 G1/S-specific cyclin-E2 [Siniperca chuatsi]XP_044028757.1 G1/S-specific cyclin-E2 [Siniperca chuatsi]
MTRQSGRLQKRSENAPGQKGKVTKQSNRKKVQPLSKLQCEKNQLVLEGVAKPCILLETREKGVTVGCDEPAVLTSGDSLVRPSPLPHLGWGSSEDVWQKMVGREQNYTHSKSFMQKHPSIQPRMRSILLDWLIEVSESYTLHRQTFYLAQDYFDRFMLTQNNIEKSMLQLIGITCLFIAAKMEEACPPKLSQMAYVTAGTYYEDEILQMELIILKALSWNLCPETAVSWLKLYFQMASMNTNSDLLEPQFPQDTYIQMTRLLDLCILNINSLDFQYRVLAASVLCHFIQQETVEKVSGLSKDAIHLCVNWMAPFVESVGCFGRATMRDLTRIKTEDRHNIQTHTDYMTMLENASQKEVKSQFPTPPNSTEKTCTH